MLACPGRMLQAGELVGQRYRLTEPLAAGGMGMVWRGRHTELDIDVAIKLMSSELDAPSALKRFKREAQAAARLRSPHIVQVLDYGIHDDQPYLVMELLRGEDLKTRLERVQRLKPVDCLNILRAVASAVELAHEHGIVHRDLKPANIFLERVRDAEVVKVLDFGVAKDTRAVDQGGTTSVGVVVGSPAFMSPEQTLGDAVGPATDVWALGVLAFQMLTGKNPFEDESLAKIFDRVLRQPIPSARDFQHDLPQSIDTFFAKALARDVNARFETPSQLAAGLEHALDTTDSRDAQARALTAIDQRRAGGDAKVPPGRAWRLAGTFSLLAVLLGVGLLLYSAEPTSEPAAAEASPVVPPSVESAPRVVRDALSLGSGGASQDAPLTPDPEPLDSAVKLSRGKPGAPPVSGKPKPVAAPGASAVVPEKSPSPAASTPQAAPSGPPLLDPKFGVPIGRPK